MIRGIIMIGAIDSTLSPHQIIVRERIRESAKNAYTNYPNTTVPTDEFVKTPQYTEFNRNMARFFAEGKQNPTVAKMIFVDEINKMAEASGYKSSLEEVENLRSDINRTRKTLPPSENAQMNVKTLPLILDKLALKGEERRHEQAVHTQMGDRLAYETKLFRHNFETENYLLYPKTYKLRDLLIKSGRFPMDSVKPKMSAEEKKKMFSDFAKRSRKFAKMA